MVVQELTTVELPQPAKSALFRATWRAQGRYDAIKAVADHPLTLEQLQVEVEELENTLTDPARVRGSMEIDTSPRLYREGYWAGLTEALSIMRGGEPGDAPHYPTPQF